MPCVVCEHFGRRGGEHSYDESCLVGRMLSSPSAVKRYVLADLHHFGLNKPGYFAETEWVENDVDATLYSSVERAEAANERLWGTHLSPRQKHIIAIVIRYGAS
jgi:hypothetical protein